MSTRSERGGPSPPAEGSPPAEAPPRPPSSGGGSRVLAVEVHLLDDTVSSFNVQYKAVGRVLFEQVCRVINLLEVDYFGLEYADSTGTKYWLDYEKPMCRQMGLSMVAPVMDFCVKFYTPDPAQLEEEFTRYLFSLQIKRDLSLGILQCSDPTAALLASYIVQASCGDYVPEDYPDHSYLSTYKFVPHQNKELEIKIMDNHKKHVGQSPAESDLNLLETARRCELYGIRMTAAKDNDGLPLNLSVAHMGVIVFQNTTKINTFSWAKIRKLSFKRRKFLIKLHPEGYGYYKETVEFFFESRNECKNFWKKCIENHAFFRCTEVKKTPRQKTRLFSRGSSFRYSGRTQKQIVEYVRENYVKRQPFQRSTSLRLPSRSSVGTSDDEEAERAPAAEASASTTPAALSEPSSPRREAGRESTAPRAPAEAGGAATPSQDTDDNISHDSYRLEEGDSSLAAAPPGSPSKDTPAADLSTDAVADLAVDITADLDVPLRVDAVPLVNGQGEREGGRRRSKAGGAELARASRSFDEEDAEFGYLLHRRGFLRDSKTRRSEGGHHRRRRAARAELGRPGAPRQASPPTIFARARALGGRSAAGSVDFVHLTQLPRADSFSSHDDSLEEDSLEREIFEVLRRKRLLGEGKAPQRRGTGQDGLPDDRSGVDGNRRLAEGKVERRAAATPGDLSPTGATLERDGVSLRGGVVTRVELEEPPRSTSSPKRKERLKRMRMDGIKMMDDSGVRSLPSAGRGVLDNDSPEEALVRLGVETSDLTLCLVGSEPLVPEGLVAQLSPTTPVTSSVATVFGEDILGGILGIPPPPEYRSSQVNEVLRRYEELERDLAYELSRLGCPPPPAADLSDLLDPKDVTARAAAFLGEVAKPEADEPQGAKPEDGEARIADSEDATSERPLSRLPEADNAETTAALAKPEDMSDSPQSSSGSSLPRSGSDGSGSSDRAEGSEEDGSGPGAGPEPRPGGRGPCSSRSPSGTERSGGSSEGDVETLGEDEPSDRTATFSEEEETALVGDEPTLCSSPFSSSVPETPEGSSHYPSFVDLDVMVGSGLLEQSSSSSSMLSSYDRNGHPLDTNPFLE
ncbi:unnamed protein product [Ixodes pacificus]